VARKTKTQPTAKFEGYQRVAKTNKFDQPKEQDPLSSNNPPPMKWERKRSNDFDGKTPRDPYAPANPANSGNQNQGVSDPANPYWQTKVYTGDPYAKSIGGNPKFNYLPLKGKKINKLKG
jgi:hypothetical protein